MRTLLVLPFAVAATIGGLLAGAGSASALGGEYLGCNITPGSTNTYSQDCSSTQAAATYQVSFAVRNETAPSTYSWSRPSKYPVVSGCSTSQNWCYLSVPGATFDRTVTVSVTLTQNGFSQTLTSSAFLPAYCNGLPC